MLHHSWDGVAVDTCVVVHGALHEEDDPEDAPLLPRREMKPKFSTTVFLFECRLPSNSGSHGIAGILASTLAVVVEFEKKILVTGAGTSIAVSLNPFGGGDGLGGVSHSCCGSMEP